MCGKCLREGETAFNLDLASLIQKKKKRQQSLQQQQTSRSEATSSANPTILAGPTSATAGTLAGSTVDHKGSA